MAVRNDAVTVSFHFLRREHQQDGQNPRITPFTQGEFDSLFRALETRPVLDLTNERHKNDLRYRNVVPIEQPLRIDQRTIFGVFKAAYWGHSYENSEKGEIPADSVSLRPFHFLLYLSESGKIYVACQYLGQFGGYTGLANMLKSLISTPENIRAHSYRLPSTFYRNAMAKEVRVSISKNSASITKPNVFQSGATIAFKKQDRNDGFELAVSDSLLSLVGEPRAVVKSAVAKLLRDNELVEVADDDIDDCTIVAVVNGQRKVIHMIETGSFATRFPIDVPLNAKGHPTYDKTKEAIIAVLTNEIISRSENV